MNRGQLRELVMANTGRTDKESLTNSAINLALKEISKKRRWLDLLTEATATLLAGENSVALATDAKRLTGAVILQDDLSSYQIKVKHKSWVDKNYPYSQFLTASKPVVGYMVGKTLHVRPGSDIERTIGYSYYGLHPDLTMDSDENLIEEADLAAVCWATYWVFHSIEKKDEAGGWLMKFEDALKDAKRFDSGNTVIMVEAEARGQDEDDYPPNFQNDPFFRRMY